MADEIDVHALAKEMSGFLGYGWFYEAAKLQEGEKPYPTAQLRHADGYGFGLRTIWNKPDRIAISGTWPKDMKGTVHVPYVPYGESPGDHIPEITVAAARGAAAIAEEIQKRFLPKYLSQWQKQAEQVTNFNEHDIGQLALIERLAVVAKEPMSPRNRELRSFAIKIGDSYSDIVADSPTSATLKLHLNQDQAEKVLKLLKEAL